MPECGYPVVISGIGETFVRNIYLMAAYIVVGQNVILPYEGRDAENLNTFQLKAGR